MDEIAPMLAKLGYDPDGNPPNYGVPDGLVANNTKEVSYAICIWVSFCRTGKMAVSFLVFFKK